MRCPHRSCHSDCRADRLRGNPLVSQLELPGIAVGENGERRNLFVRRGAEAITRSRTWVAVLVVELYSTTTAPGVTA